MSDRVTAWLRAKAPAVLLPVGTTVLAFAIGGLVVAATGHNPIDAYKAIFNGPGLPLNSLAPVRGRTNARRLSELLLNSLNPSRTQWVNRSTPADGTMAVVDELKLSNKVWTSQRIFDEQINPAILLADGATSLRRFT
jgi:hypothetical protein